MKHETAHHPPAETTTAGQYTALVATLQHQRVHPAPEPEVQDFVREARLRFEGHFKSDGTPSRGWIWAALASTLAVAFVAVAGWQLGWLHSGVPAQQHPPAPHHHMAHANEPQHNEVQPREEAASPTGAHPPHTVAALHPGSQPPNPLANDEPETPLGLRVSEVQGRAEPRTPNTRVRAGQRVRTQPGGELRLIDPATASLHVQGATELFVQAWNASESRLELERGTVVSEVKPRTSAQVYEVVTAYATVSVVGTAFAVEHRPGDATFVRCFEGKVRVATLDGRSLGLLGAGESLKVLSPRALAEPSSAEVSPQAEPERPNIEQLPDSARRPPELLPLRVGRADIPVRTAARTPEPRALPKRGELPPPNAATQAAAEPASTPQQIPPQSPTLTEAEVLAQSRTLLGAGREQEASALLAAHEPKTWRVVAAQADVCRLQGKLSDATKLYQQAIASAGQKAPPRLHADLAETHTKRGDQRAAAEAWLALVAAHPTATEAADALWTLAQAEEKRDRNQQAAHHLRALLRDHPSHRHSTKALARLGRQLIATGAWSETNTLLSSHCQGARGEREEICLLARARVALGQGQPTEAATLLKTYDSRFPAGTRRTEANHLKTALNPAN